MSKKEHKRILKDSIFSIKFLINGKKYRVKNLTYKAFKKLSKKYKRYIIQKGYFNINYL